MAWRHVAEAKQRLARQEWLVGELELGEATDLLSEARALLERMRDFLRTCQAHLDYEAAKQEGKTDDAGLQRLLNLMNATEIEPNPLKPG